MIPLTISGAPTNLSAFCLFITNPPGFATPTLLPGTSQSNLVAFVDDFGGGVFRVTGLVTNDPPITNGLAVSLSYPVPGGTAIGNYLLVLPASPPADAPVGPNPEARLLVTSALTASSGSNGLISVVNVSPPWLTSVTRLGNGAFQFGFTNTSASFSVFASTNLTLPLTNWTVLGPATMISPGTYQFTDPAATNYPIRFYDVRSP